MHSLRRLILLVSTGLLVLVIHPDIASAQVYPARPVRVIVPFAPGGPADVLARIITQKLSQNLRQQFFVENQPGAGGNLGMGAAARAAPDGHTITVVGPSFVVNPGLYDKIPYDPFKDFAPVTLVAVVPNVLVVHPSLPPTNLKELIAFLKQNTGKYSFAHPGNGTTAQFSGEMFRRSQNLDIAPVSFNGSGPAIQSVLGGHTPIAFTVITPAVAQAREGKLRALAVTTSVRSQALPDVPTLAEAGLPNQESDTLLGVLAPANTPAPIVDLLHREIKSGLTQQDVKPKLAELGFEIVTNTPTEFAARIRTDVQRWAEVIRAANIKAP